VLPGNTFSYTLPQKWMLLSRIYRTPQAVKHLHRPCAKELGALLVSIEQLGPSLSDPSSPRN